ncbi:bifunctional diguanylate cyclase/phosphodiesterase [Glaciecola petra]|uniref:EAL domain-containing protein n=1 Tax=Glaciecola petra TaxID=3075602 RepID=A0ABU2ZQI8_9ALTE|nr:EAL domain-containing protein [Aestuariibacter sp. P117]MDT0594898.1 EAL domain-containing protein [Aestuariibacter sp. P117]
MTKQLIKQDNDKKYLSVVSHFAIEMLSLTSESDIVWFLAQDVVAQMGFEDAVIYLYDENRQVLNQVAAYGNKSQDEKTVLCPIEIPLGRGVVGKVALERKAIRIGNTRSFEDYIVDDDERLSELAVPMQVEGQLIGVIDSEHPQTDFFTEQHTKILTAIASMAAIKIEKTRTTDQLQDTVNALEHNVKIQDSLYAIAELVHKSSSLEEFCQSIHQLVGRILNARNFIIALEELEEKTIRFPYCADECDVFIDNKIPLDYTLPSITGYILKHQRALLAQKKDLEKLVDAKEMCVEGTVPEAMLGVHFGQDEIRGVVIVQSYDQEDKYDSSDLQLLQYVANHVYIALKRIKAKAELEFLALHDPLTSLPNRVLLSERVNEAIQLYNQNKIRQLAILFLDLDKFKDINDMHGHHAGDELLVFISSQLKSIMGKNDTLARIGGDEFAVVLQDIESKSAIEEVANKIIKAVYHPFKFEKYVLQTTVSIGVAIYNNETISQEKLFVEADEAMYLAKLKGRNQVFFYDQKYTNKNVHSHKLELEFSDAMFNQDLYLVFQPIVNLSSNTIISAECLIRWNHPTLGEILPSSFINELQRIGKIIELDVYVFKSALKHLKTIHQLTGKKFRLSMNVSAVGFASAYFSSVVEEYKKEYAKELEYLIFEITEQTLLENLNDVKAAMEGYRALGIQIALDDFGTGYSSLSYLHELHFDILKIDRSFMLKKQSSSKSLIILEAVISLARALNMTTTAEGVETKAQLSKINELGCNNGQGYYFSRPFSFESLIEMLNYEAKEPLDSTSSDSVKKVSE